MLNGLNNQKLYCILIGFCGSPFMSYFMNLDCKKNLMLSARGNINNRVVLLPISCVSSNIILSILTQLAFLKCS